MNLKTAMTRRRRASIALEAAVSFSFALCLIILVLGAVISVVASEESDWAALHSVSDLNFVHNTLIGTPRLNSITSASIATLSYRATMSQNSLAKPMGMVKAKPDEYGSLSLGFVYRFQAAGIMPSDAIILPLGGYKVSDGIDFRDETVYITRTGEKYHKEGCFHLRKSKFGISLDKALEQGYGPCKHCHGEP